MSDLQTMPRAIILAGQRPGEDPLCQSAGVMWKADIEIGGIAMLDRVIATLRQAGIPDPITISGYPGERDGTVSVEGGRGPADSALIASQEGPFPILLTTCDHPLLTSCMVNEFVEGAKASGADLCVGIATEGTIQAAYPDTKRTYMRFADHAVSGCNLFYIANANGLEGICFWRTAQHVRKQPHKLALKIGPKLALSYMRGKLTMADGAAALSRRIGASVAPVILSQAEAAIDVDKPGDLILAERILAQRDPADS